RIADVVIQVVHLHGAAPHRVACLQQRGQRRGVLPLVVEQQPLNVERHRQRRIRVLRQPCFFQRAVLVVPCERDLREDFVRAGGGQRDREPAVLPPLVEPADTDHLPGPPRQTAPLPPNAL